MTSPRSRRCVASCWGLHAQNGTQTNNGHLPENCSVRGRPRKNQARLSASGLPPRCSHGVYCANDPEPSGLRDVAEQHRRREPTRSVHHPSDGSPAATPNLHAAEEAQFPAQAAEAVQHGRTLAHSRQLRPRTQNRLPGKAFAFSSFCLLRRIALRQKEKQRSLREVAPGAIPASEKSTVLFISGALQRECPARTGSTGHFHRH